MRSLARLLVLTGFAIGCGSSLQPPDGGGGGSGGCVKIPPVPGDCNTCSCANGMMVCTTGHCLEALDKITGQNLGYDPDAWER